MSRIEAANARCETIYEAFIVVEAAKVFAEKTLDGTIEKREGKVREGASRCDAITRLFYCQAPQTSKPILRRLIKANRKF